ncbi:MAG: glycosyltransferase family 39 protein [Candidatus Sungbacteria bacterium]|nr:glycosyltransferase family 39 protein [Candidatus Sungbacteria bacterium]
MHILKSPLTYILILTALLLFGSVWNDSATMDELAHIPAGFGYVTQIDGRLNPEHPPLLKMVSALFAELAVNPYFPTDTRAWQSDINGQWDHGRIFLYESGNNADAIIFWSRVPFILLTLFFAMLLWRWTRERFGPLTALFTLIFFAFSPTILAHGRLVTTDLGAAFGFFIGFIAFLKFLENPTWKNTFIAGLLFGMAELLKYSLVLLIPLYGIMLLTWTLTLPQIRMHARIKHFFALAGKTAAIGCIGIAIIWIAYIPLVLHYPQEKQLRDTEAILESYPNKTLASLDLFFIRHPATRPLGQYMLGFLMVTQRASGGNTAYFLGEVSAAGSRIYFPVMYLYKEPLPFHLLTILALWIGIQNIRRKKTGYGLPDIGEWIHSHFTEFSAISFITLYWASSVISPLNIGVRHVLPTFPFIYFLVGKKLAEWVEMHITVNPKNMMSVFLELSRRFIATIPKYGLIALLVLWLIAETIATYPYFLSFYNELAGGTKNGYKIAVDSNYDWGQDLLRLRKFVEENNIETIAVDYFGGSNPKYYLGDKFVPWQSSKGPASGWFAISATFQQGTFGNTAPGFFRGPEDSYIWLQPYEPVARAGTSIFIYKLP